VGGRSIESVGSVVINNAGRIALGGAGGVWTDLSGGLQPLIPKGIQAPGMPDGVQADGTFAVALDDAGFVTWSGSLRSAGSTASIGRAIWLSRGPGQTWPVVRTGHPFAPQAETVTELPAPPRLNNGTLAVVGRLGPAAGGAAGTGDLVQFLLPGAGASHAPRPPFVLARRNDPVPGAPGERFTTDQFPGVGARVAGTGVAVFNAAYLHPPAVGPVLRGGRRDVDRHRPQGRPGSPTRRRRADRDRLVRVGERGGRRAVPRQGRGARSDRRGRRRDAMARPGDRHAPPGRPRWRRARRDRADGRHTLARLELGAVE
jgi:hypothetical protein